MFSDSEEKWLGRILRKLNEGHPWQELHKIKGIGETGTIAPDYGETTTLSS